MAPRRYVGQEDTDEHRLKNVTGNGCESDSGMEHAYTGIEMRYGSPIIQGAKHMLSIKSHPIKEQ
jgi:hypothetical protein